MALCKTKEFTFATSFTKDKLHYIQEHPEKIFQEFKIGKPLWI